MQTLTRIDVMLSLDVRLEDEDLTVLKTVWELRSERSEKEEMEMHRLTKKMKQRRWKPDKQDEEEKRGVG